MKIHNMMEDVIRQRVQEIFEEEKSTGKKGFCTCSQCRSDVACYALNRIKPMYVTSGKGLAHIESDYPQKLQREADLVSMIHRGIEHVAAAKRHQESERVEEEEKVPEGPFFNFPQITGRLIDSVNFEAASGIKISLLENAKLMKMVDIKWQNPYTSVPSTAGIFTFWPYPKKAEAAGQRSKFELEIHVEEPAYETFHHYFTLDLKASEHFLDLASSDRVFALSDLYLIPAGKD